MIWHQLLNWSRTLDLRDLSDAAHQWGSDEAQTAPIPVNIGAHQASLAISFEAGRMWERTRTVAKDTPIVDDFWTGVRAEVDHQIKRWGTTHDERKEPTDWIWLLGHLSGKACTAHITGNAEKALHHCISSAAVLAHWHAAIKNKLAPSLKVEHDPSRAAGEALSGAES